MNYRTNNKKITEEESKIIRKLFLNGMTGADIAAKFKRSVNTIYKYTVSVEQRESYAAKDKAYKKNLPEDKKNARKLRNIAYLNTESGFMLSKYHDVKRSSQKKQARPINAGKEIELLSQEEFFELWTQHKAKQGITCGYTGEPLIMKKKLPPKVGRNKVPKNQLSVDCLDPEIGYTKENIVFCSWGFNDRKNAVKIKDCYLIIKMHEERNKHGVI